jgi:hypothetical protein
MTFVDDFEKGDTAMLADHSSWEAVTTIADLVKIRHLEWHELEGPWKASSSDPGLGWQCPKKFFFSG